jgi:hypothetical protein
MKKNIYSFIFLFVSAFAFGQSVLIEPANADKNFVFKSTGFTYGNISTTFSAGADLNFRRSATGDGSTGTIVGLISTFSDRFVLKGATAHALGLGSGGSEYMRITTNGKIGIGSGNTNPQSNLHVYEPTTGFIQAMQITTDATGLAATDGLGFSIFSSSDVISPRAARIMNNENAQLIFGANNMNVMNITPTGNVGINSLLGGAPTARFQVFHDTENNATKPHINLVNAVDANNGMIKMTNITGSRYFGQYFNLNSATAANNFVSFDYNGTTPILDMQGNGNVKVSGFTTLGNDPLAPKIKMKKLTGITNVAQGGNVSIAHGLFPAKIIAINVMVRNNGTTADAWVGNGYTGVPGFEFSYQYDGGNIFIVNTPGNSANILSKDIKIVVTYEE